jgi:adenylyltransferase/sulfurtransferase
MIGRVDTTPPLDIQARDLVAAQRAGRPVVLVDCRERWEYELVHLPEALLIPLGELQARTREIPTGGDVVVYCHHGIRSRHGAMILRRAGVEQARSLAGGIEHWATEIDPSLPRY